MAAGICPVGDSHRLLRLRAWLAEPEVKLGFDIISLLGGGGYGQAPRERPQWGEHRWDLPPLPRRCSRGRVVRGSAWRENPLLVVGAE